MPTQVAALPGVLDLRTPANVNSFYRPISAFLVVNKITMIVNTPEEELCDRGMGSGDVGSGGEPVPSLFFLFFRINNFYPLTGPFQLTGLV